MQTCKTTEENYNLKVVSLKLFIIPNPQTAQIIRTSARIVKQVPSIWDECVDFGCTWSHTARKIIHSLPAEPSVLWHVRPHVCFSNHSDRCTLLHSFHSDKVWYFCFLLKESEVSFMPHVNNVGWWSERVLQRLTGGTQLFSQPLEGAASLLPAAMDNGEFMDWGFIPAEPQKYWWRNSEWWKPHFVLLDVGKDGLYENHSSTQCHPLWYSILCESQHFRQVMEVSPAHRCETQTRIFLKQNLMVLVYI